MIETASFVERLRGAGLGWYTGVPCSYLTPLINRAINDPRAGYLPAANEGDAVAAASGGYLGGRPGVVLMQNSGLGNAVNPLTSLAYIFRTPMLLVVTLRGDPTIGDEPQHELMGRMTLSLLEQMEIPWRWLGDDPAELDETIGALTGAMARTRRPAALVARRGVFEPHPLEPTRPDPPRYEPGPTVSLWDAARRSSRREALGRILEQTADQRTVVIASTGYTGRELYALDDRANHLYMVGSMGCASSLGLGLANARPDRRVVVIDGDGAALMRMGAFSTIGARAGSNLIHLILDNEAHASTGGQATLSAGVRFAAVAHACGYARAIEGDDLGLLDLALTGAGAEGPTLAHLKINASNIASPPRPTQTPEQVKDRLMNLLGVAPAFESGPVRARPARRSAAVLLNPGPVNLSEPVRRALGGPDLCHREPEYFELQDRVRRGLVDVYALAPREWSAVLVAGSGTSAVEAMIASLVPADGRLLIVDNGVYGARMAEIARRHTIDHSTLACEWDQPVDLARLGAALGREAGVTHLAIVHHETTTGRLNGLEPVADLCKARGVRLLVDSVSSFAGEELRPDEWGFDACALTANKCLHGAPGVAAVVARREAIARSDRRSTLCLDLSMLAREQDKPGTAFTPAVHVLHALDAALDELRRQGGWRARHAEYRRRAERVAEGFAECGVEPFIPARESSVVLRSYHLPVGITYERLHDELKERGFVIYAGQGPFSNRMFRISTMGAIDDADLDRLAASVARIRPALAEAPVGSIGAG